jgi:hypothetical protein
MSLITRRSRRTGTAASESDLFRRVFETVLRRCIRERLVGGEGFAVDASLIKADANRQKGIEGDKGLPPEAAAEQSRAGAGHTAAKPSLLTRRTT